MTHYHTETLHFKTEKGRGDSRMESSKRTSYPFDRGPDGYPSSYFFRFDDGAKLKKRDSGDVSYSKKSVSYLQETLNQIGINKEKVAISALFPPP